MDRRSFIKAAGVTALSLTASRSFAAPQRRKPNIIYILADDLGYGELGCFGQKLIKTPNIDRIAQKGIKFTQHYSGSALCAPSRCTLMTGKHTGHCYVRNNYRLPQEGNIPIPAGEVTVAEIMKKAGYKTACIGKWGLGFPHSEGDPNNQGFDHWFGYNCQRQAHNYYPDHLWRNQQKVMLEGNKGPKQEQYSHDLLTQESLQFIETSKDKPFFLYLPYTIPHTKFQVPDLGQYAEKDWKQKHKIQAAMISRMDADVGKIVDLLQKHGIEDDTLVIFTSDNGPHGAAGTIDKFKSDGGLRSRKGRLYEGGIRVPMVAQWPGMIEPNTTTDHISAFWDFLPTCAELAGTKCPDDIDGVSFAPTLLGKKDKQKEHKYLYWELGRRQAIRKGDLKAIRRIKKDRSKDTVELYNLTEDLTEQNDISKERPELVKEMVAIMENAHKPSTVYPLYPSEKSERPDSVKHMF
ncbi:Arylsulfatase [Anaerohalosphaera lusitana]|uniref:Arylsulfatase n=1 Tax=Anaerohalosphaera lusitana TaxID=1936003 RepID=A0A1U9NML5_9BACT|nr:arylsulfatase [Anaerohalosphaera lusitana]AQT68840.1 Arylsulfatase [Anaerohalosphaera lusitana]